MNTANSEVKDAGFAEQWDDLLYSCSQCEQFALALVFIWSVIGGNPDQPQRQLGISIAHFLACELKAYADSLEWDLRTLKG